MESSSYKTIFCSSSDETFQESGIVFSYLSFVSYNLVSSLNGLIDDIWFAEMNSSYCILRFTLDLSIGTILLMMLSSDFMIVGESGVYLILFILFCTSTIGKSSDSSF